MSDKRRVQTIIDLWDPLNLLTFCPSDEYTSEAEEIYKAMQEKSVTADELGLVIFSVFKKRFAETFTDSKEDCLQIAEKIISAQ